MSDDPKLGATGEFPDGKLGPDDEGEPLPEGIEVYVRVYLTSPESGVDVAVKLSRFTTVPNFSALKGLKGLPAFGNIKDWRRMTRDEIEAYKADADDEEDA